MCIRDSSISSEDDGPKANVILECDDCSTSGTLVMESEDKLTNVMWNFDCSEGSAFPMELEIDCNKTYNFKYEDGNKQTIEKKIKIKSGMNIINVFQWIQMEDGNRGMEEGRRKSDDENT